MPKLKDFLTALAKKAGYDTESVTAKPFFDGLPDTDVPEDIHAGVDNSLISVKDAKNNHSEIRNHYKSQTLDSLDKTIETVLTEYSVDDQTRNEILGIPSTYQRFPAVIKKIAELTEKKAGAGTKDKASIQKEIDDLHKQVAAEKLNRETDKKAFENQMTTYRIDSKINQMLSGFKTIHDELDPEIKATVIKTLLQKEIQDNQAKFGDIVPEKWIKL